MSKMSKVKQLTESISGYSCPNCGTICSAHTLISMSEVEFDDKFEFTYSWDECHKCQNCETIYIIHNGT